MTDDSHESLRLWLRLLTCSHLIENQVRKALAAQFKTTLPRFDLMAQLERASQGLQMGELSRRMLVTGGNITGIVDQLERAGLIVRTEDPGDRRVYLVKLTKEGRRQFAYMAAEHESWIVRLFAGIPKREQRTLNGSLSRLRAQLTREQP
ncbi:MAG TPA: MarR family transcriptional regulator [Steroidobacteraceae bacterium]|nr:MarR family transcriptional regulator [Steroidobacteraceae bacterium]